MKDIEEITQGMNITSFLLKCKSDFKFFCDNVLFDLFEEKYGGLKPYMNEWFNLIETNNRVYVLAARGFAKTTVFGVAYPIWLAYTKTNKQIMVISRAEKQSKRILSIIKSTIENNPLLVELKPREAKETWSAFQINTKSKCKVFCRPFTKGILGERTDYVLMDEAEAYEYPELFFDYVVPTLNPGGKIALISSSQIGSTLLNLIEEKGINYKIKKFPAIKDNKSIWEERFPLKCSCKDKSKCGCDSLEEKRKELGESVFQRNFMCNPISESGRSAFTAQSIEFCKDKKRGFTVELKGGRVYLGCDFAIASGATADFDVYTVAEAIEDIGIIKYGEYHRTPDIREKVNKIKNIVEKQNVDMVICDESHIGSEVIKLLRFEGIPTTAQSFHSLARTKLLNNLKVLLDNAKIVIPTNPNDDQARNFSDRLEKELLSVEEQRNKAGISRYVSTGAHDDMVMSLAMAVSKIQLRRKYDDYWGIVK